MDGWKTQDTVAVREGGCRLNVTLPRRGLPSSSLMTTTLADWRLVVDTCRPGFMATNSTATVSPGWRAGMR
jgi:hypothetical protein